MALLPDYFLTIFDAAGITGHCLPMATWHGSSPKTSAHFSHPSTLYQFSDLDFIVISEIQQYYTDPCHNCT